MSAAAMWRQPVPVALPVCRLPGLALSGAQPDLTLQGLCTPREVFVAIAAEGYQISYRRLPMSRERTPQVGWVSCGRVQSAGVRGWGAQACSRAAHPALACFARL